MHRGVQTLVVITSFMASATAFANDALTKPTNATAREHLSKGNKLYNVRDFDEAIVEYKAGELVEATPVFDYNLGQCYRNLGKYEDAIWHYERFLNRGQPEGQVRDAVVGFIAQMRSDLEQQAKKPEPVAPAPAPLVEPVRKPPPPPPPAVVAHYEGEPWYADRVGWLLTGGGALALGAGSLFLIDAHGMHGDADKTPSQKSRMDLYDRADTRRLIGIAALAGGGALLAVGVIRLALTPTARAHGAELGVVLSPNGVFVSGGF